MARLLLILTILISAACGGDNLSEAGSSIDAEGRLDAGPPPRADFGVLPDVGLDAELDADAGDDAATRCPKGLEEGDGGCLPGVPGDESFEQEGRWATFGGARVDVDEGRLELDRDAICTPGGSGAEQAFSLGPYDEVGPLRVSVDLLYDPCDDSDLRPCEPASILFAQIGPSFFQIPTPFGQETESRTVRFCLPATAYDGTPTLRFWAREYDESACLDTERRTVMTGIDAVRLDPASEEDCPAAGIPGGDFESQLPNAQPQLWDVNRGGTGQVVVVEESGDREARITLTSACSNAQFQNVVRAPGVGDGGGLALQFDQSMTSSTPLQVSFGPVQRLFRGEDPGLRRICIPSYLAGHAEQLLFRVTGDTDCAVSHDYDARIDDIAFVDAPECGPAGAIRNGTFDDAVIPSWNASSSPFGEVEATGGRAILEILQTCEAATLEQWTTPAAGTNAVAYRYRSTSDFASVAVRPLAEPGFDRVALAPAVEWTEATTCLPPEPRVPFSFSFLLRSTTMPCGVSESNLLEVDDVRFTNDGNCPERLF